EGFELVMFFYGMGIEASSDGVMWQLLGYSGIGVLLTAVSAWAYFSGLKFFKAQIFFRVTTVFLLITAGSLLLAAFRKFSQMDLIPYTEPLWDTAFLLDERGSFGQFFSTMTGYESSPQALAVALYAGFWAIVGLLYYEW